MCVIADAGNVEVLVAGDGHGCGVDLGFDRAEQCQIGIVDGYAAPREDNQITILVGLDGIGRTGKLGPRLHDRLEWQIARSVDQGYFKEVASADQAVLVRAANECLVVGAEGESVQKPFHGEERVAFTAVVWIKGCLWVVVHVADSAQEDGTFLSQGDVADIVFEVEPSTLDRIMPEVESDEFRDVSDKGAGGVCVDEVEIAGKGWVKRQCFGLPGEDVLERLSFVVKGCDDAGPIGGEGLGVRHSVDVRVRVEGCRLQGCEGYDAGDNEKKEIRAGIGSWLGF